MRTINDVDTQGKLQDLLERVRDNESCKVDYRVNTNDLEFKANQETPHIIAEGSHGAPTQIFNVNDVCLDQITTCLLYTSPSPRD